MILRRKRTSDSAADEAAENSGGQSDHPSVRADGPWDVTEFQVPSDDGAYLDLGGLIVKGRPGCDVQIPADPKSGRPAAVVFVNKQAALELRAFAAQRSGGLWEDIRSDIAGEAARLKGECDVLDGMHGPELRLRVPAKSREGEEAIQHSRIVGVEGPRWFLRGTFYGQAAIEPDDDGLLEAAFRDVVVVRGEGPMAPRESIPLTVPENAVIREEQA